MQPTRYARLGVVTLFAMLAMSVAPRHSWAQAEPTGRLTPVSQTASGVQVMFTAVGLPAGASVDSKDVRVTVGGSPAAVDVRPVAHSGTIDRQVMLVVDSSGSMAGAGIAAARRAALAFLMAVPSDVRVGLLAFSDRPHVLVYPSTSRSQLSAAIRRLSAGGETSMYDAVALALRVLGSRGDRMLVLLSDGADTKSRDSEQSVTARLSRSGVRMDAVALHTAASVQAALARLTSVAHGVMTPAAGAPQLAAALSSVARTFSSQLLLNITMPAQDLGRHVELDASVATSVGILHASMALLVGEPVAVPPARSAPSDGSSTSHPRRVPWLLLGLVFVAIAGLAYSTLLALNDRRSPAARTRRLLERSTIASADPDAPRTTDAAAKGLIKRLVSLADRIAESPERKAKLEMQLARANVSLTPSEWLVVRLLVMVGTAAVSALLFRSVLVGALLGVVALVGCRIWLQLKIKRRLKAFEEKLPGSLQLVASSLRAGFSLAQALDGVVHEGVQPISEEMHRALAEVRLGMPLEEALEGVGERMRSIDFRWVVMAIRIQREVGGNLAEVLLNTTTVMRERARLRRQVKALSAEGRLSAYVLLGMPVLVSLFLVMFRRAYIRPLYTQPLGIGMLVFSIVLLVVGAFWMRNVVTVEA